MDTTNRIVYGDCVIECANRDGSYVLTVTSSAASYEAEIDAPIKRFTSVICKDTHASVKCGIVKYNVPRVEKDPLKITIARQEREIVDLRERVERLEEIIAREDSCRQYFWYRLADNVERPSMTAVIGATITFSKFKVVLYSYDSQAYGDKYSSKDVNTPSENDTKEILRIETSNGNGFEVHDAADGVLKNKVTANKIRFWNDKQLMPPPFCVMFYN